MSVQAEDIEQEQSIEDTLRAILIELRWIRLILADANDSKLTRNDIDG